MSEEALQMRARANEIDRLLELNDWEREKLNDKIEQLTAKRDEMLAERDSLRAEQSGLLRMLASGTV